MIELEVLDNHVSLHKHIEITYVVDGYEACLLDDSGAELKNAFGNTIYQVLLNLQSQLK